ncbi:hypothetical protein AAMO2058_001617300 [Amorphochlora amoebiformis]
MVRIRVSTPWALVIALCVGIFIYRGASAHPRTSRRLRLSLLAHNMLKGSHPDSYPLKLTATKVVNEAVEFETEHLMKVLGRIDYHVLLEAVRAVGLPSELLPSELPPRIDPDRDLPLLQKLHRALYEVRVESGELHCPVTGERYPIRNFIPDLLRKTAAFDKPWKQMQEEGDQDYLRTVR